MRLELAQAEDFQPTGEPDDPTARLLARVDIAGVPHHLEAVAVTYVKHDPSDNDATMQVAADGSWQETLDQIYAVAGDYDCFQTTEINGREYVLCITPYC